MKKILLVATVQSHICQFHRALIEMLRSTDEEIEIHVAARNNLAEKNGLRLDFADKVFDVPFERSPFSAKNLKAYRMLRQIIDDGQYAIIHCNTPVGGILTRLAAKKHRKNGVKVIYTAHGFHFYQGAPKKNWLMYYPIEKFFSRYTDTLVTINEEDYAFATRKFRCRVARIHGAGVDQRRYRPIAAAAAEEKKRKMGFRQHERLILSVGELLPNKNHLMAVRAMREVVGSVPEAVLLIAGNGPEQAAIEQEISRLELQNNVRLIGYRTDLEDYRQICALAVACSKREGLGLNVIEAMMTGNPVVATRNRGHNELVVNGENGYLVNQDDAADMADKIVRLLTDRETYASFSAAGQATAAQYSFEVVKRELRGIYGTI